MSVFHPSRRLVLGLLGASTAAFALPVPMPARAQSEPASFSFDALAADAERRAGLPWVPASAQPWTTLSIDYDLYRRIYFLEDQMRWSDGGAVRLAAYPTGWLFNRPVRLYEVKDGVAGPLDFFTRDYEFRHPEMKAAADAMGDTPFPVAGLRINSPINHDGFDELASFLGASYFRALGRGNVYGLSARGLVINSWTDGEAEEFPDFTAFYVERPKEGGPLVVHAELDSPSVAGAYRFVIDAAGPSRQTTEMEVEARLFFRADVKQLGVAPMTSMYLFAEANRTGYDDYRPQVHDSNGLAVHRASGINAWRALNNPAFPTSSWLREFNPRAFGLEQRGRSFDEYQDAGAHYERRPSLICEPLEDWGDGFVRVTESFARNETEDNIGAFWVPAEPVKAGDRRTYRYRLLWGDLPPPENGPLGYVYETRTGHGGVSGGLPEPDSVRKFVIDFQGGPLSDAELLREGVDAFVDVSTGVIKTKAISRVEGTQRWRVAMDIDFADATLSELRVYLISGGRQITETWLYQWTRQQ
ncbi:glucan biosynthesis protein [Devosia enhydra]|uniref:glucan biosynthesis protein n=1 Tax=Devosia enhydra TaxID=665118 RepID=UPI00093027B9|nr:glucan biosynthesis protein [Devosia enhydra]